MKKYFSFLLPALALCLMTACQEDVHPNQSRVVLDFQINQTEWQYAGLDNNNYFSASFTTPELTQEVKDNGLVLVYRVFNYGSPNEMQQMLPFTRQHEYLADQDNNTWGFYQELVDFEFGEQVINIFYSASDFDYELDTAFTPETMHFRVLMIW